MENDISICDPKECVRKNFAAFNAHDVEGIVETYTEDCELLDMTQTEPILGRELLRDYGNQLYEAFPDIHIENALMISEGHIVAAKFELVGTHKGDFLGCKGTNRTIRWQTCSFFELTDSNERIQKETYYYDQGRLMEQLRGSATV